MVLTQPIAPILTDDPQAKYAELAALVPEGQKYEQNFDYINTENPEASEAHYLEDLYPAATVLGPDGDIGSWEICQSMLGACGHFSGIAAYASAPEPYRLESGIYPTEISPIGLYFFRIRDPENLFGTKWIAIDSKMPTKPGGKSYFIGLPTSGAIAPLLAIKAEASARGGNFDEVTNSQKFQSQISFAWFPSVEIKCETFQQLADAIAHGGACIFSMSQQYDTTGAAITPSGVVYGHGFAAPDTIETTNPDGSLVQLVRIENPWGGGSDVVGDYSDNAPFWDAHPELASKRIDAQQAGGNYWVSYNYFCQLTGRTNFNVRVPLPLPSHPHVKPTLTYVFDETTAITPPYTAQLCALATKKNDLITVQVTEQTNLIFMTRWRGGVGGRNYQLKFANMSNAFVVLTDTTYNAGMGSKTVTLSPGTYKMLPCTQNMMVDRGTLEITIMSDRDFVLSRNGAIA